MWEKKWRKNGGSCQGGAPKVKGKVNPNLNSKSNLNSSMHARNNCYYLPMQNFGFKYHDRNRVNVDQNPRRPIHEKPRNGRPRQVKFSLPKEKKVIENQGINPKKGRHMPRNDRSRNVQGGQINSRVRNLEKEN